MVDIRWDLSKSDKLKRERGVSFEEIIQAKLLAVKEHPNRSHQNIMLFEHKNYIKYTKIWKEGELK